MQKIEALGPTREDLVYSLITGEKIDFFLPEERTTVPIKVIGIEREDGSGYSFNLKILTNEIRGKKAKEAYYNTNEKHGWILFSSNDN